MTVQSDSVKDSNHHSQEKCLENAAHISHKTSPKPAHRKLTFSQEGHNEKMLDKGDYSQKLHVSGVNNGSLKHAERRIKGSPLTGNRDNRDVNVSCDAAQSCSSGSLHPASVAASQLSAAPSRSRKAGLNSKDMRTLTMVAEMQHEMHQLLNDLMTKVANVQRLQTELVHSRQLQDSADRQRGVGIFQEWVLVAFVLVFQTLLQWYFSH